MPIYEYCCENEKCTEYKKVVDILKDRNKLENEEKCEVCFEVMKRKFASSIAVGNIAQEDRDNPKEMMKRSGQFKDNITTFNTLHKFESKTDYEYYCENEECSKFNEKIIITKSMDLSEEKENCEECRQELRRVYGATWRWGKGWRPDSDVRKEALVKAFDEDNQDKIAELMTHWDSTDKSLKRKVVNNEKYMIVDKGTKVNYTYKCANAECNEFNKEIVVRKSTKDCDTEEKCESCESIMNKVFGVGGIQVN